MTALPNGHLAVVADRKVRDYLLAPAQPKSIFFNAAGFRRAAWPALQGALKRHAETRAIATISTSPFGTKYVLQCGLETPDGRAPCVKTVWITHPGGIEPHFVTAYPA